MKVRAAMVLTAAACAVLGCASEPYPLDFTAFAVDVPHSAQSCSAGSMNLAPVQPISVSLPPGLPAVEPPPDARRHRSNDSFEIAFDVSASGETVNIRHSGPAWHREHRVVRQAIREAVDAHAHTRYEWVGPGAPRFVTGCTALYSFTQGPW